MIPVNDLIEIFRKTLSRELTGEEYDQIFDYYNHKKSYIEIRTENRIYHYQLNKRNELDFRMIDLPVPE
jgi:hypothetical protein